MARPLSKKNSYPETAPVGLDSCCVRQQNMLESGIHPDPSKFGNKDVENDKSHLSP
nr:MAG TPA: hypothetical protein [Caudoviricetes sp.]